MKKLVVHKLFRVLFSLCLSLGLLLIVTNIDRIKAQSPEPTPTPPVLEQFEPIYPPPETVPLDAPISTQGIVKTFQVVADTEIREASPTTNYGVEPMMEVGYDNYPPEIRWRQRALLNFDVISYLPPGTTIHQATLKLYMSGYCDTGPSLFQVYRLTESWSELTATWNNQPAFAEGYGSNLIPIGSNTFGWYNFNITSLVQGWIDGTYSEYGLILRGPEGAPQCAFRDFRTKGGGGYTTPPQLVVDYTLPPRALTVSENNVTFMRQCGIGGPATQVITLQSNEATLKNWTANLNGGAGWLSLSKSSGKVSRIFSDQITLSANEATPCPGTATAQIGLNASGLGNSPQTITVTLQQSSEPILLVSPTDLSFNHTCSSGLPPAQVITLQTTSSTPKNWIANLSGGDGWLSLNKSSGQVSSSTPDQIIVSVNQTNPCPSNGAAQIQISTPDLGNSPQTVSVVLQQTAADTFRVYLPLIVKNSLGSTDYSVEGLPPSPVTPPVQFANTGSSSIHTSAMADRIALVVGVADYQYLQPPANFTMLRGGKWGEDLLLPRSDSYEMRKRFGCKCSLTSGASSLEEITNQALQEEVIFLPEEHATKANIDYAIEWIDEREDASTEVLIYFSGHGGPINDQPPLDEADNQDELLGVYNTNDTPQFLNYVRDDDFKNQLAALETQNLAVILDACNSAGMEITNTHRAVLAASREDQNSWESSELEHGVFTYYMLEAMRTPSSDTNGDSWLSVQEIYNYARGPVNNYVTSKEGVNQNLVLNLTQDVKVAPLFASCSCQ